MVDTCSFCGKHQSQVAKLMVNGTGRIAFCNECAQVCLDFLADERQ